MQNHSDQQLVASYLKGDKQALEILISRYLRMIYNFIYRYVNRAQDAEDITQEVFVKVWRKLKRFDQNKSFKTWIFPIAKNTAIDFLRKKKAITFSEFSVRGGNQEEGENLLAETIADPAPLPPELFDRKNLSQELAEAINKLSLKYRLVLVFHYNDHFTFQEIAEFLEEPLNTIKSRHRRAVIRLKKLLLRS